MSDVIDMQAMRYMNLFEKISRIRVKKCFVYNNNLIFAVPKSMLFTAIGKNGENAKTVSATLRKRIKVIADADYPTIQNFILDIINPVQVMKVEVKDFVVTIHANKQSKASLIGRDRVREKELEDILKRFFNIQEVKIL